jgi:hypothetical protein
MREKRTAVFEIICGDDTCFLCRYLRRKNNGRVCVLFDCKVICSESGHYLRHATCITMFLPVEAE